MSDYMHSLVVALPYFLAVLGAGMWLGWSLRGRREKRP